MSVNNETIEDKIKSINATNKYEEMQVDWFPPCNSDEYYFVSYCHKDYKAVFKNLFELQNQGKNSISVWYDWQIHVGTSWEKEVEDHIHNFNCKGIIFYISNNFIQSDAIFKEIQWVKDSRKQYIPIYIPNDTTEILTAENLYKQEVSEAEWDKERIQVLSEFFGEKINYLKIDDNIKNIIYKIKNFDPLPLFNTKVVTDFCIRRLNMINRSLLEISSIYNPMIREIGLRDYPKNSRVIGPYCFANCRRLEKIIIPIEIIIIAKDAFFGCESLKEVYYDGTVKEWCDIWFESFDSNPMAYASHFYVKNSKGGWEELKNVTLWNSFTELHYSFCNCKSLLSLTIYGDGEIGKNAFSGCSNLSSVVIGDSVESIADDAFSDCRNLTSVVIGNSVKSIAYNAFFNCYRIVEVYNLSTLIAIDTVLSLSLYAKIIHTSLEEESRLIENDDCVFYRGENNKYYLVSYKGTKTELILPNDLEGKSYEINQFAFSDCRNLTNVVIGNNVERIAKYAFFGCSNLLRVVIGKKVKEIEKNAFSDCYRLVEVYNLSTLNITVGSWKNGEVGRSAKVIYTSLKENSRLLEKDNYIFYKDENNKYYLISYKGTRTNLILPNNIEGNDYEINEDAFFKCSSLTSVIIRDKVTRIGAGAFFGCCNLSSVVIGDSVASIAENAFFGCESLKEIYYEGTIFEFMESCKPLTAIFPYLKHFYIRNANNEWEEVLDEKLLCKIKFFKNNSK